MSEIVSTKVVFSAKGQIWLDGALVWECTGIHIGDSTHTAEWYATKCGEAELERVRNLERESETDGGYLFGDTGLYSAVPNFE